MIFPNTQSWRWNIEQDGGAIGSWGYSIPSIGFFTLHFGFTIFLSLHQQSITRFLLSLRSWVTLKRSLTLARCLVIMRSGCKNSFQAGLTPIMQSQLLLSLFRWWKPYPSKATTGLSPQKSWWHHYLLNNFGTRFGQTTLLTLSNPSWEMKKTL